MNHSTTKQPAFVQAQAVQERPPPHQAGTAWAWVRQYVFESPRTFALTLACAAILYWVLRGLLDFLVLDATWSGGAVQACQASIAQGRYGACWPFIDAKLGYFVFGGYPPPQRWRVVLFFVLAAAGIVWLLARRIRAKRVGAAYFFVVLPPLSYALLVGADTLGLPHVSTDLWGGILVTLVVSLVGIVFSLPIGIVLALGRRSELPFVRLACTVAIELGRGVPLITVLFMFNTMLPLFLPEGLRPDRLLRPLVGVTLFASAYMAEVVRGGLQALPKGQYEGAQSLGLGYWQTTFLIVLPQALRIVVPGIVNTFIGLFKDTTLVAMVGILDLLKVVEVAINDPAWATPVTRYTGYAFLAFFYCACCYAMSRYSRSVERALARSEKR
ncbi:amino acid ABC transporter permease [Bordetella bronchiseptica]|uniref:amino acid ABC transporter permease n=1 Tax=Bordetella bronchiseptica TaxID=518 RepID=UPI00028ACA44|nr:amino acid ABC transporter permease [Bordetella bronchiseptica]AWQ04575.1 amino acid ABC transporter permease [Bordetella bronchiseptica]KAK51396.1 putative general L-amino acid transport system permease protein AapM [Bordetella bronchiseptica OSU054]KCV55435.1 putative general L-amino acid transport system permease protein AapM [Bordetella bronchiseptica 7E71]KDB77554.1 putative general L-amino acid transport system permease protein AapM [Bordetella bronchiseptica CA90 BB1334]KDC16430.1 pu